MEIVSAVWIPRVRIISTLIMIMIVIYFFSIIAFLFFYKDFNSNLSNSCKGLLECSITIFDVWYKADGAIGGFLEDNYSSLTQGEDEYNPDFFRIIYDFLFNFLVTILLAEILSGIITDTFSSIRAKRESLNEKQSFMCFVCGRKREEIPDFKSHTKYVHNIWDYLYYFGYIKNKQVLENEQEEEIRRMLDEKDLSFFPCFAKNLDIERELNSQNNGAIRGKMNMMSEEVSQLKQQNKSISEQIKSIGEQNNSLKEENKKMNESLMKILEKLDPAENK